MIFIDGQKEEVLEIEKETHRLAVVNMNWRNAKAADLYALFYSLVTPNGPIKIKSVAIYPTLFGLHRVKEIKQEEQEDLRLQVEHQQYMDDLEKRIEPWLIDRLGEDKYNLCRRKSRPIVQFDDDDYDVDPWNCWPNILYDNDERCRYYFAVVECDSCATALQIYKQNEGAVFEFDGSNPLDLRFIPDHMDFQHPPQDVATIKSLTPSLIRYWELLLAYDDEGTYGNDDEGGLILISNHSTSGSEEHKEECFHEND
ncbi:hypothetical protein RYX36_017410 [Vicia faba]